MKCSPTWVALLAALAFPSVSRVAAETTWKSGPARVALIELYTSEGCSSCPPAEAWLAGLRNDSGLWKNFVPIAFHVNYWDHLGWRDRLASPAFTAREQAYAAAWSSSSVYTPCFVRDGAEWRPGGRTVDWPAATMNRADAGRLTLTRKAEAAWQIEFIPPANAGKNVAGFEVHVALLGSGLVSKVRAGENAGRELHHEFAALGLESAELKWSDTGGHFTTVVMSPSVDPAFPRRAVAAWITRRGSVEPLQAVGGWLD